MDFPKLGPVEAFPAEVGGQQVVCLRDPYCFSDRVLRRGPVHRAEDLAYGTRGSSLSLAKITTPFLA